MCGLFGFLRVPSSKVMLRDYLQNMTLAGTLRGSESVGYYFGAPNVGHIEKFAMNGALVAYSKVMPNLAAMASSSTLLIGHHRASTHGEVSTANCHPFQRVHGDTTIIGAHNGVISSFNRNEAGRTFVVDSDWAMYKLAELGDEAFTKFEGAYALSYYDSHKATLSLVCNESRPLWYAYVRKENAMFYASEWGMLAWVADRNDIDLEEVTQLEPFEKHEFPFNNPREEVVSKVSDFVKPKVHTFPHQRHESWRQQDWGIGWEGVDDRYDYTSRSRGGYHRGSGGGGNPYSPGERSFLTSKDEQEAADALGYLDQECEVVVINQGGVNEKTSTCMGVCTVGSDTETAIIRGVDKRNWWKLAKGTMFKAKIIGARWMAPKEGQEKEFRLIVGPPSSVRFSGNNKKQFLIASDLEVMTRLKSGSKPN